MITETGQRAGITTNPERRKIEWASKYPRMSNWREAGPFLSRKDAQAWENAQEDCQKSAGGREPDHPFVLWYGYRFDC